MLRMLMFPAIGLALLSAFALYTVSYQTKRLADGNLLAEQEITNLKREIAVLRAERSYLMRPDRIEPLARELGMRPARGAQFGVVGDLHAKQQRQR